MADVGGLAPPHMDICVHTCAPVIPFFFLKEDKLGHPLLSTRIVAQSLSWERGDRGGRCGLGISEKKLEVKTLGVVNSFALRREIENYFTTPHRLHCETQSTREKGEG